MDTQQFASFYDAHVRDIYKYLYYRTQHRETAEDLTSQVFLKALDKFAAYDETRGTFIAWLYRIARNTLIDHYRATRATLDIEDVWDLQSDTDVARDAEAHERIAKLQPYLTALPKEQRELLLLRLWDGLSYAEISEIVGKSEDACKMAYSRVVAKLRKEVPASILLLLLFTHL
ncbi:MAG: sigma-70 family RNA polymerase sigma factor [Patescibacteria group bacterium]|jgi:RNA polymerase sigma-70 factor (ECF subfamily)